MNKLLAAFTGLLAAMGRSTDNIKLNASGEPEVTAEDLESLTADVTKLHSEADAKVAAKEAALTTAKADHEKALADLKATHATELAAAKAGQDKAVADLTAAHSKELETANARITELETELGAGSGTGSGKPPKGENTGTPSWVDADAPHYAELKKMGIETGF